MIRTFGIGPLAQKGIFGRLEYDFRPKTSAISRESVKQCVLEKGRFRMFWGSMVGHVVRT